MDNQPSRIIDPTLVVNQMMEKANLITNKGLREEWLNGIEKYLKTGDPHALVDACKWRQYPVDMEEFMFGKFYLGLEKRDIYPAVLDACIELDSGKYDHAVLKGCIGAGKTTIANIGIARETYKLSCLRSAQNTFGIQKQAAIAMTIQSVRLSTAKKAVYEELEQLIRRSPYFIKEFPYDAKIKSELYFRDQNLRIMPVTSGSTGAISMNVIGGVLDEMNFMQKIENSRSSYADPTSGSYDQAVQLYNTISRRRRSRFSNKGQLPGILYVISSSRYPDDFTEVKAREAEMCGGHDPKIFVFSKSSWEVKPFAYGEARFKVAVGDEVYKSAICSSEEEAEDYLMQGLKVIDVPEDLRQEFEKDIDGSIRDYAGLTTLTTNPFIQQRDKVKKAAELADRYGYFNIFNVEEFDISYGIPKVILDKVRLDVKQPRFVHIDLGLKKDACGICVGHVAGSKLIRKTDDNGNVFNEILPVIAIDCILRIVPPNGGEIEFSKVRDLLYDLRDNVGLPIKTVTLDGFQSVDTRQILQKKGFVSGYQSVEKIEPYNALRNALYEERLLIPNHQRLKKELIELETYVKNGKEKVDHTHTGTKDLADALCGVVAFINKLRSSWANLPFTENSDYSIFGDINIVRQLNNKYGSIKNSRVNVVAAEGFTGRKKVLRRASITRTARK
jgi:hypothetical protein